MTRLKLLALLSMVIVLAGCGSEYYENRQTAGHLDNRVVRDSDDCAYLAVQSNDPEVVYLKFVPDASGEQCRFGYTERVRSGVTIQ